MMPKLLLQLWYLLLASVEVLLRNLLDQVVKIFKCQREIRYIELLLHTAWAFDGFSIKNEFS